MQHRFFRPIALLSLALGAAACSDAPTAPKAASAPAVLAAKHTLGSQFTGIPVSGATADGLNTFAGTLNVTSFANQGGQLTAVGTVTGTLTNLATGVTNSVTDLAVTAPVTAAGTCEILQLDLGAIHLNLLGLVVDLAPVHLNIFAQSGPGNLLGNLLCAITNLLNGGASLAGLVAALNQLLALLG